MPLHRLTAYLLTYWFISLRKDNIFMPHADQKEGGWRFRAPPPSPENSNLSNSHTKFTENKIGLGPIPLPRKHNYPLETAPPPQKKKIWMRACIQNLPWDGISSCRYFWQTWSSLREWRNPWTTLRPQPRPPGR